MLRKMFRDDKSIAVIIPKEVSKALHLEAGEYLDIIKVDQHIEAHPVFIEKKRNNLQNYVEE